MNTGPDTLGTAENESGSAKPDKGTRLPRSLPKMSPGEQNMKTRPDALATAKNEFGRAKHENGTKNPRYRRKRVRARKA
jgi:hypothetical protein